MNVFISWSGNRSRALAEAFRDWLPKVLQATKPFMSEADIDKGAKWDAKISKELAQTNFSLICLTPENRASPALHFEAGALSKSIEESRLWTYLYDLSYTDVKWPLSEFQHTLAEKEDTRKLLHSMNIALGSKGLSDNDLNEVFETWWPKLESRLQNIPNPTEHVPQRTDRDILEEILEQTRSRHDELLLSWVTERVEGPRAVSYLDEGRIISAEEAQKKYSPWNRYAWSPLAANKGFLFFNTKIGEAFYLRTEGMTERDKDEKQSE
jgi:hypothetical protein